MTCKQASRQAERKKERKKESSCCSLQRDEETPPTLSFSNRFGPKDTGTFHCCPPLTDVAFGSSIFSDMTIFTNSFSTAASSSSSFFFCCCIFLFFVFSVSLVAGLTFDFTTKAADGRTISLPSGTCSSYSAPGTNIDHRGKGRRETPN